MEPRIPAVSLSTAFTEDAMHWPTSSQPRHPLWRGGRRRYHDCLAHTSQANVSQSRPGRFDKDDIVNAEVLGQVDRKFIACIVHSNAENEDEEGAALSKTGEQGRQRKVLVLIDQHAADERVRVERFLQELCDGFLQCPSADAAGKHCQRAGVQTRVLDAPLPVLLTEHEVQRLGDDDVLAAFRRWGLTFADAKRTANCAASLPSGEEAGSHSGYAQVNVVTVPELLGDKASRRRIFSASALGGQLTVVVERSWSLAMNCGTSSRDISPS